MMLPTKERKNQKYNEDSDSLLSHSDLEEHEERTYPKPNRWASIRYTLLLIFTHLLVAGTAVCLWTYGKPDLDSKCSFHTSNYSPVLKDVGVKYGEVLYNGSFFHEQIYRKDPGLEVDAAWKALGADYRALRVPESEAQRSGISLDHVKIKAKHGGGYPANVEGLHHLHCLNLLRKGLVYNYDYYKKLGKGPFANEDHVVKVHITHCLDILRQELMCTVDTGVLGQVWVYPKNPEPFVDFNTRHTCKNFEAIRAWAEVRQLPEEPPEDFLERPSGSIWAEIP